MTFEEEFPSLKGCCVNREDVEERGKLPLYNEFAISSGCLDKQRVKESFVKLSKELTNKYFEGAVRNPVNDLIYNEFKELGL